jgi:tol-pal system protein YbgF
MSSPGRFLERSLFAALILCTAAVPALAQTAAPTPLRLETEQIERDLGTAQQGLAELPEGRQAAFLQNRITAIEEQLRGLTGRVEEAEFRDRQTQLRIDQLVADLDRRLASLEAATTAGPATGDALESGAMLGATGQTVSPGEDTGDGAGGGTMPEVMTAEPGQAPMGSSGAAIEPDPAARDGFVLGTIPRDALLGIPTPSTDGPTGTAPAAALQGNSASRFNAALNLLQTGDYSAAAVAFDRWVDDFPDDPQAPVASFWLGEAQLANGDLANAAATFAANYRTFGAEAPRAADNLLKLGTALAAMGDTTRACQTFGEMDRRYRDAGSGLRQALERERRAAGCS